MQRILENGLGRMFVMTLQQGDCLLESIEEQARAAGLRYAVLLCAIGTLDRLSYHRVTTVDEIPVEEHAIVDGPFELAAVQGMIVDGRPHFHLVASTPDRTYVAHLEPGSRVLYCAEILLAEIRGLDDVVRTTNSMGHPQYGLRTASAG